METRISSLVTPFVRFVMLPLFAIAGLGMLVMTVGSVIRGDANGSMFIVPGIAWFVMMYFTVGRAWRAQKVSMTATGLRVGDRVDEIRFADIAGITQSVLTSPELVTIHTRSGEQIRFLATYRPRFWFSTHPIVGTLRDKAVAAVRAPGSEIDPELGIAPARVVRTSARR